ELCGDPASSQRLHDPIRHQDLSDCAGRHPCRFTRSQRAGGSSSRRIVGGAFSEPLSGRQRVSTASQSSGCALAPQTGYTTPEKSVDEELSFDQREKSRSLRPRIFSGASRKTNTVGPARTAWPSSRLL